MKLNKKNEVIKEIISKPPHKIIQWGSLCIFFIFILIFVVSFTLKYPETLQAEIIIENNFVSITAQNDGILLNLQKQDGEVINQNDTIATIYNSDCQESNYFIKSPMFGRLIYCDNWGNKERFSKNENLFYIASENSKHFTGYISISAAFYNKVSKGQKVDIYLEEYPYSIYGILIGTVKTIINIPEDGFYKVIIDIPCKTNLNKNIMVNTYIKGVAKIVIKNISIGEKIVAPILEFI